MPVEPVRPKLPPLNALRAFEAAARLGGFTAAATELCVTPAAVAQQVKALEAWVGAKLFKRRAKGIELTTEGWRSFDGLQPAFDQLGRAVLAMRSAARPKRLHLAALPSVAQLWLSPRLPHIRARLQDVDISITVMEQPPNLEREPYDAALFFYDRPVGRVLAQDRIFPVATPEIAKTIFRASDLLSVNCLGDSTWDRDWDRWLRANTSDPPQVRGSVFSLYSLAVTEAINGAGVLIGHACLIAEPLARGDLVPVLGERAQPGLYLCATTQDAAQNPLRDEVLRLLQD